jgi:hypothetical protein
MPSRPAVWSGSNTPGSAATLTCSAWASPARRVRGPFKPRMCRARAGERCKFDSIGLGVTGAPHLRPFHATAVRGVRGGVPQVRLDRRGRHRRTAFVAPLRHGLSLHFWNLEQSSTEKAGIPPTYHEPLQEVVTSPLPAPLGAEQNRTCGACAGEYRKFDLIGVGVTGVLRLLPFYATDVRGVRGGSAASSTRSARA